MTGHTDWVFSVAYSPSGDELISTAGDGVRYWDRESGRLLWRSGDKKNVSHAVWLNITEVATSSADASLAIWRVSSGKRLAALLAEPSTTPKTARRPGDQPTAPK